MHRAIFNVLWLKHEFGEPIVEPKFPHTGRFLFHFGQYLALRQIMFEKQCLFKHLNVYALNFLLSLGLPRGFQITYFDVFKM